MTIGENTRWKLCFWFPTPPHTNKSSFPTLRGVWSCVLLLAQQAAEVHAHHTVADNLLESVGS